MENLITFEDIVPNSKKLRKLAQQFTRAGANVASIDAEGRTRRSSGINYREVALSYVDNQKVILRIKQSGDIFQVVINGSVTPIKNQNDQVKAIGEIADRLDAGRAKFQQKLARVKVAMPQGLKTAAPKIEQQLEEAEAVLDKQIGEATLRLETLKAELATSAPQAPAPGGVAAGSQIMDSVDSHDNLIVMSDDERKQANELAQSIISGMVLDDTTHAKTMLEISLQIVENNLPIHLAEGNAEQAELDKAAAQSYRTALEILEGKVMASIEPTDEQDEAPVPENQGLLDL